MPFTFGSVSTVKGTAGNRSFSYTVDEGNDTCLVCGVGGGIPYNISTTYNGVSMTKVYQISQHSVVGAFFYLLAPATGSNTLSVSWGGNANYIIHVFAVYGINQRIPISSYLSTQGVTTSPSINAISSPDQLMIDLLGKDASSVSPGPGQTFLAAGYQHTYANGMSYEVAKDTTTTMSWTSNLNSNYNLGVVPFNPAPAAAGTPIWF